MHLSEWARRHATSDAPGNAIGDLVGGATTASVRRARGLPPAAVEGIRSFYALIDPGPRACDGTACHFAEGSQELAARLAELGSARGALRKVRCLGHCYAAPSFQSGSRVF